MKYLLLAAVFIAARAAAQDSTFRLVRQIPLDAVDFAVDNLGSIYAITSDNQLRKYTAQGDSMAVFDEVRRYGTLTGLDVTNPLKVLLFYKDFMTVLALDRFLGRLYKLDLRTVGIQEANSVTLAYDNNLWVYDEQNAELKRISDGGQVLMASNDFRQLFNEEVNPVEIVDQDGLVYLNDPDNGIYVFDYYGGFKVKLSFTGVSGLRVFNKNIFGLRGESMWSYRPGTLQEKESPLPATAKGADRVLIVYGGLYVLKAHVLYYYAIAGPSTPIKTP